MARRTTSGIAARRRRLTLEAPASTPDGAGGGLETFAPVASMWASLRWLGGEERRQADRWEQASRQEIVIRWRSGVTAGMRFRAGGEVFAIVTAGDPDGDRRRLVCLCEEIGP